MLHFLDFNFAFGTRIYNISFQIAIEIKLNLTNNLFNVLPAMYTVKQLKAKALQVKEAILEMESMLEEYEYHKISQKEQLFYERLKLPLNATALQLFDKLEVSLTVKLALMDLFREAHLESFELLKEEPVPLPEEMRAFSAFIWLKKIDPYEILRFKNVGRKSVRSLVDYIRMLDAILDE